MKKPARLLDAHRQVRLSSAIRVAGRGPPNLGAGKDAVSAVEVAIDVLPAVTKRAMPLRLRAQLYTDVPSMSRSIISTAIRPVAEAFASAAHVTNCPGQYRLW